MARIAAGLICLLLLAGIAAADELAQSCSDLSPDGQTCCKNTFNLQEENRIMFAAPTVVDYSESTGNLLVRGPVPVLVREGAGNQKGCKNFADWKFAYDELNTMIKNKKTDAPLYFSDAKKAAMVTDLQDFDLKDYHVIIISLLNNGDTNQLYFSVEKAAFGGAFSTCSGSPLQQGTLRGTEANLVWSNTIGCPDNNPTCLHDRMYTNSDNFCGWVDTVQNITALLTTKDPSGKKRFIYYHCNHGADRTGGITIGYLLTANPTMTLPHAIMYTTYLGRESGSPPWAPDPGARNIAAAYCKSIGGLCDMNEGTRVFLPGSDTHSHLPGQEDPVVTPTLSPVTTTVPVPVQTPVSPGRYIPPGSSEVTF
ncbi:MAG: hypothetical protein GYA23_03305 [Methanomicrobiales archaeon]|nr:hypothetical protein [Methanomicrobiales archaeon]